MFRQILLAYDGSQPSQKAFERSLEMAQALNAQLAIVAVVRPPDFAEDVETEAILEAGRQHFERELAALRDRAIAGGLTPRILVKFGHPAEQIIGAADELGADLIVTGHRGKGLFERWLLGSVSRLVIAYARCAVLVVR